MASFVRWNETTQIWEKAVNPNDPITAWNHLPVQNPTLPLDIANKQYVDGLVGGGPFVPYNGAVANVNLGAFSLTATRINAITTTFVSGPTLGSSANSAFTINATNLVAFGLNFGLSASGDTWIQSQRFDGGVTTYNLLLQPAGGLVILGGAIRERSRTVAMGDWQAWTPTWKGYSSTDGIIGNGTLIGSYTLVGKTVYYTIFLSTGSSTVFPGGLWAFTLPFAPANTTIVGSALLYKGSTGAMRRSTTGPGAYFLGIPNSVCIISNRASDNLDSFVGPGFPWTWEVNDFVFISGQYEMA